MSNWTTETVRRDKPNTTNAYRDPERPEIKWRQFDKDEEHGSYEILAANEMCLIGKTNLKGKMCLIGKSTCKTWNLATISGVRRIP